MNDSNCFPFTKLSVQAQYERVQREFSLLLRQEDPRSISFATSLKNRHKNRYLDILANEATLYPQVTDAPGASTPYYVNGNLIDLGLPHKFVACQAPVVQGIPDFLAMLYEKKISLVIMVTKLEEGGFVKADRYWPEERGSGSIAVSGNCGLTISEDPGKAYEVEDKLKITRRYLILQRADEPPHKFTQVQYTGWPDHGIPQSAASLEALLTNVKNSPTTVPVVVHCSAGIGRTGTLIGAYATLTHLERGTLTDTTVYDVVSVMRRQRFGMVQRVEQYFVIYLTLMCRLGVDIKALVGLLNSRTTAAASTAAAGGGGAGKKRSSQRLEKKRIS
ncbi:tyrosine specific protein phosphatase [Trypanosoma cruzi Dm28c]|uniref:Tyrosine specific protein phosphatase n=2 Tax=Trypanosoma cruzi TaxID=5693 RepID=V5BGF8_TRYCR|nr:tyrosine specific protein phosphatase [Trypanosoma cruzi Dm28c]KAF8288246.1 putative tyrosine specific protein phosphatase [Trypanosoma cruzi]PBJ67884.1 tyrosine specific protein phosphatase [Trypanosoma cruzi cruzi]PWU88006.1 putative tyrosine specific protein phosphatase [Trypanosoma cruzi]